MIKNLKKPKIYKRENIIKYLKLATSQIDINNGLECIKIQGNSITATNSYYLINIKLETGFIDGLYNLKTLEKVDENFPEFEKIFIKEDFTFIEANNLINFYNSLEFSKHKNTNIEVVNINEHFYNTEYFDNIINLINNTFNSVIRIDLKQDKTGKLQFETDSIIAVIMPLNK